MKSAVIVSNKEIMGGTPVFKGTRVPVSYLFGYIEEGLSIKEFVESYPTVKLRQAKSVVKLVFKIMEKELYQNKNKFGVYEL